MPCCYAWSVVRRRRPDPGPTRSPVGEFSVADIGYFLTITFATDQPLGAGLDETVPGLQAWYARVAARPAVTTEVTGLLAASGRVATG
jgi:glutathione S-transferase